MLWKQTFRPQERSVRQNISTSSLCPIDKLLETSCSLRITCSIGPFLCWQFAQGQRSIFLPKFQFWFSRARRDDGRTDGQQVNCHIYNSLSKVPVLNQLNSPRSRPCTTFHDTTVRFESASNLKSGRPPLRRRSILPSRIYCVAFGGAMSL